MTDVYPHPMKRSPTVSAQPTATARSQRGPTRAVPAEGTRSVIVSAAQRVLEDEGYADLSLRHVADAAGVAVGNLTYYCRNKQALVRAVIEALVEEFSAGMMQRFENLSRSPAENFQVVIDWLITESAARKTNRVMRELWVMALHDPFVAGAVDDFYDELMARAVSLLRRGQPGLTEQSAREIVHLATMITEGSSVLYGTRPNRAVDLRAVTRIAADLLGGAVRERTGGR
jgi:AcrR family transcriptional regulator